MILVCDVAASCCSLRCGVEPCLVGTGRNGASLVSPVGSAAWCVAFALVILAVLMLDEYLSKLEKNRRQ